MTNYYEQLYDVDFLSGNEYGASVGGASIRIRAGGPVWNSWQGKRLTTDEAQYHWNSLLNASSQHNLLADLSKISSKQDRALLALILCESAYREQNHERFSALLRVLWSSGFGDVSLKARKLAAAQQSLTLIGESNVHDRKVISGSRQNSPKHTLSRMIDAAVTFCNENDLKRYSTDDVKVELPVRKEWTALGGDINNIEHVERFYKETYAYVLELTAANHQVETLFNYRLVLSHLRELGVNRIYDYGAGIGTFVLLASKMGFECVYADLESRTQDYARQHIGELGGQVTFEVLDYHDPKPPPGLDCIVCTEVMEHVFEPEKLVHRIYNALKPGGIFVVSESFDYTDEFCMHIPVHKGKGGQEFLNFLEKTGFLRIPFPFDSYPTMHVKL